MVEKLRVAVGQLQSTPDVASNMAQIRRLVEEASSRGVHWLALPENAPYLGPESGKEAVAESMDGSLLKSIEAMSRDSGVAVLLGSTVESMTDGARTYNTSVLIDGSGQQVARYRKIHLFDVELPGGQRLWESEATAPGDEVVLAGLRGWSVGMTVCYDLRFPELYRRLRRRGAQVLCVPSAFTVRTGPDHWEVLLRARAIENQCYVVAPAQWGPHCPGRESYGRAMIIDPWGTVVAQVSDGVGLAVAELEMSRVSEVRRRMPCLEHARLLPQ